MKWKKATENKENTNINKVKLTKSKDVINKSTVTATQVDKKPLPQRWLVELARQNFTYFVNKLKSQEAKRRLNIIRAIRFQLKSRFMKLYRYYRHHKYGEPRPLEDKKKAATPDKTMSMLIKDDATDYGEEMLQELNLL